jgi:hypothetical protein
MQKSLLGYLYCFFNATIQPASRGIQVSTTIEKELGHLVTGEVIDRAKTYPNEIILLGIFAK